jgi:hypothetical protein
MTGTSRATPALLWSRAALLAAVVVVVSALGHVWADGLLPGPAAMVGLVAVTALVSARFLTRQASTLRLVVLLVGGQAAIHGVLSLLAGHGAGHGASHAAGHAAGHGGGAAASGGWVFDGHQAERSGSYFDQVEAMQAATQLTGQSTALSAAAGAGQAGWSHLVEHLAAQSIPMFLAHTVVVVLLGVWLAVGERALWAVLTLACGRVLDVVAQATRRPGQTVGLLLERVRRAPYLGGVARAVVPLPHLLHHVVAHRGPPALLAA